MNEEKTRLRVKLGAAEVEYEGGADFLKNEVMPQITRIIDLVNDRADFQRTPPVLQLEPAAHTVLPVSQIASDITTHTIAKVLNANSATELAIAALARLNIVEGRPSASRQEILDEMRKAPGFFKQSFVNNHSNTMKVIVRDRVNLTGTDQYSLSNKERIDLEQKLKDHLHGN